MSLRALPWHLVQVLKGASTRRRRTASSPRRSSFNSSSAPRRSLPCPTSSPSRAAGCRHRLEKPLSPVSCSCKEHGRRPSPRGQKRLAVGVRRVRPPPKIAISACAAGY